MIKLILTPIALTIDVVTLWGVLILSLLSFDSRYVKAHSDIFQHKELYFTRLVWARNKN